MQLDIDTEPSIKSSTNLAVLWRSLFEGQLFVFSSHCADGRCFALLGRASGTKAPSLRNRQILERIFEGESQKALAFELGVSGATIAAHSAAALRSIVRDHLVSRAPLILVMAALASRGLQLGPAQLDDLHDDGRWTISVTVPCDTLHSRLSPCEWEVARLSMEGQAHESIADVRGTSTRTVANQLGVVFHKLGISGRGMLRAKAIREYAERLGGMSEAPGGSISALPVPAAASAHWAEQRLLAYG